LPFDKRRADITAAKFLGGEHGARERNCRLRSADTVFIQGAQHVFHPPIALTGGGQGEPRSRIVFIVRNIPRESIEALFGALGAL